MKIITKILLNLMAVLLLPLTLLAGAVDTALCYADTPVNAFDNTAVERDLGENFDYSKYPFSNLKTPEVYSLTEYCYSDNNLINNNYALYIYVYNPQAINFSTTTGANKINVAISHNLLGEPSEFANINLIYCGKTSGERNGLFYKFKVNGSEIWSTAEYYNNNFGKRRYDITGIQLLEKGDLTAKDYKVNQSYEYTGYSAGYGSDIKLTGKKLVDEFETVELNVNHTYYRFKSSSKGEGYQSQLDTVYFRVPNRLLEEYGKLQRIKAEWYEFKTKEIVVTQNDDFFNAVKPYIGVDVSHYNDTIGYGLIRDREAMGTGKSGEWGWNLDYHDYITLYKTDTLYYLFLTKEISNYDPYGAVTEQGGVTSNALYDYILNYSGGNDSPEYLQIKDGKTIPAALFEDDIDDSRKIDNESGKIQMGYSYYDFNADVDLQVLKTWEDTNPTFWDNWAEYGLLNSITGKIPQDTGATVAPIYQLKDGDLNGTAAEVADRLLINANDVSALRLEKAAADLADETIILFRFATSDYYSEEIDIVSYGTGFLGSDEYISNEAYVAQASCFFNFDVIQLTFSADDVETVVGVVANPIDIISDITPPHNNGCSASNLKNLLTYILIAFFVILLIWLFVKLVGLYRKSSDSKKINEIYKKNKKK